MADGTSLNNQFLVAMPGLDDGWFGRSVTLLCEHSDDGALGLVVNRPTELHLGTMLDHIDMPHDDLDGDPIVYWGGPVQPERGFVVHGSSGDWESSLCVADDLYVTTSRDVLEALGRGMGPRHFLVMLGYAGWDAGQLEEEILHNAWLNTPIDRDILFGRQAGDRWRAATRLLGLDVTRLAGHVGHA